MIAERIFQPTAPYNLAGTIGAAGFLSVLGRVVAVKPGAIAYRRALRIGSRLVLTETDAVGTPDAPALRVRLLAFAPPLAFDDPAIIETAFAAAARMLNLTLDLASFYAMARQDTGLWATVAPLVGVRPLLAGSVFEALAITIVEQQISLLAAQNGERWLIDAYGEAILYEGERYPVFPTPARLAALVDEDLRAMKITFVRINRILAIAQGVASGALDLEACAAMTPTDAAAALDAIPGVGAWTAAWTVTRTHGAFTYVGSADVALRAAANAYYYGQTGRLDRDRLDAHFARYAPHDGAAGYYTLMRYALEKYAR